MFAASIDQVAVAGSAGVDPAVCVRFPIAAAVGITGIAEPRNTEVLSGHWNAM